MSNIFIIAKPVHFSKQNFVHIDEMRLLYDSVDDEIFNLAYSIFLCANPRKLVFFWWTKICPHLNPNSGEPQSQKLNWKIEILHEYKFRTDVKGPSVRFLGKNSENRRMIDDRLIRLHVKFNKMVLLHSNPTKISFHKHSISTYRHFRWKHRLNRHKIWIFFVH